MAKKKQRSELISYIRFSPSSYTPYYLIDTSKPLGDPAVMRGVYVTKVEPAQAKEPGAPAYPRPFPTAYLCDVSVSYSPYGNREANSQPYEFNEANAGLYTFTDAERAALPALGKSMGRVSGRWNSGEMFQVRPVGAPKVTVTTGKGRRAWTREQEAPFTPLYDFESARREIFTTRILALSGRRFPKAHNTIHWFRSLTPAALKAVALACDVPDTKAAWDEYRSFKPAS